MDKTLAIVDFDRTLFDPQFYQAFIWYAWWGGLLTHEAAIEIQTRLNDPNQTIDLLETLRERAVNTDAAVGLARTHIKPNKFLYPDVPNFLELLDAHVAKTVIMTTATGQYWQEIKLQMCPALGKFQQIMLSGNKGAHIKSNLKRKNHQLVLHDLPGEWFDGIMLIDDRVDALRPLVGESGITLWHVERPGSKYRRSRDHTGIHHVTTLNEVQIP